MYLSASPSPVVCDFFDQSTVHISPLAAGQLITSSARVDAAVDGMSHSAISISSHVGAAGRDSASVA